jgi:hypothetical protein
MEQRGVKAKRVRVTTGRVVVNPEPLTAEVERRTTQVQVILATFIMAMMPVGHMLVVKLSNYY